MDVLVDILRIIRFSGVIDLRPEFSAPWSIETPSCTNFAETIQANTSHIVPFHIVAERNCWVKAKTDICQALSPGDIIIFPTEILIFWAIARLLCSLGAADRVGEELPRHHRSRSQVLPFFPSAKNDGRPAESTLSAATSEALQRRRAQHRSVSQLQA